MQPMIYVGGGKLFAKGFPPPRNFGAANISPPYFSKTFIQKQTHRSAETEDVSVVLFKKVFGGEREGDLFKEKVPLVIICFILPCPCGL